MRIQCIMCFTIVRVEDSAMGSRIGCPNCGKRIAVPRARFERAFVIDDFVIESEIGKGGMATVYLAKQLSMDRPVALKVLLEQYLSEKRFVELFLKEAKSAARLNHPNIIQPIKVGVEDGILFYAMEYIKGSTLAERIFKDNTVELDHALNIVQQAAEALHTAWTQEGLIHRDVKPDNIMLAEEGHAKIMDLGIAITKQEADNVEVSGTPKFMAPEMFRRETLDCRTDIYCLGATLYNAICGYPPFSGSDLKEIARRHMTEEVRFPDRNVMYIPQRVKKLISRMMAKRPDDRYQDYDELLKDIVFIRKRLAPDADMVPSVHTISFSKYRLLEEISESPSEVYRRREEKRRQVAVAKEQAERPAPMLTRFHLAILAGLILAIGALGGLLWWAETTKPSAYEQQVSRFLRQSVDADDLTGQHAAGTALLEEFPDQPRLADREARVTLQNRLLEMQAEILRYRERGLGERLADLESSAAALDEDRATHKAARATLAEQEADLAKRQAQLQKQLDDLAEQRRELALREARTEHIETTLEIQQARIAAQQEKLDATAGRLNQQLICSIQWRIIEKCRGMKFQEALMLVDSTPEGVFWDGWRERKRQEITAAGHAIRAVYNSGYEFSGRVLSVGRVIAVERDTMRVARTERAGGDDVESFQDLPLSAVPLTDTMQLIAAASTADAHGADWRRALALCWGDFELLETLAPDDEALADFIQACFEQQATEIEALLRNEEREIARARARLLRSRYGQLETYKNLEERLVSLFRTPATPPANGSATPTTTAADPSGGSGGAGGTPDSGGTPDGGAERPPTP